jgi:hypothetical protein
MRWVYIAAVWALGCSLPPLTLGWAQVAPEPASLNAVREAADDICRTTEQPGQRSEAEIDREVQAKLNAFVAKGASLGIEVGGRDDKSVLADDVAVALKSSANCREDVFHELVAKMRPAPAAPARTATETDRLPTTAAHLPTTAALPPLAAVPLPAGAEPLPSGAAERMALLKKLLDDLPKGNIVVGAPDRMTVGERRTVQARLGIDVPIAKLHEGLEAETQRLDGQLKISSEMEARLDAPGFAVTPTSSARQAIAAGYPTVWSWDIEAKSDGEQALEATLYAFIDTGSGEVEERIESFQRTIDVMVRAQTWTEWLKSVADEVGSIQTVVSAMFAACAAVLAWLGLSAQRKRKRTGARVKARDRALPK